MSLRLWFLRQTHGSPPVTALEESTCDCLFDEAFLLVEQEQVWAARMIFQIACLHMLYAYAFLETPYRWKTVTDTLKRIGDIANCAFESRLTKMIMAQTALEAPVLRRYTSSRGSPANAETNAAWEIFESIQTNLALAYPGEDYGPRNTVRRRLTHLLDQLTFSIDLGSKAEAMVTLEEIKALQTESDLCDDRAMHDILDSFASSIGLEVSPNVGMLTGGSGLREPLASHGIRWPSLATDTCSIHLSCNGSRSFTNGSEGT